VDQKELALLYTCLFEEINSCIKDDCLEHLKHLIDFLTFALENSKQNDALGRCFLINMFFLPFCVLLLVLITISYL
jgi:U3 small nucleolar RNA-associated protein 20